MIFLMPLYFIIVCVVIYKLMKKYKGQHKWRRFFLLAFLFYLPVGWDVILGRAYFYYLCNKDAGIHIYETVELGPEHWNEDGTPKFITTKTHNGETYFNNFDEAYFDNRYEFHVARIDRTFSTSFNILRDLMQIVESDSKKVLGEEVRYLYWGGWVWNTEQPFSTQSEVCFPLNDYADNPLAREDTPPWYKKFVSYIFLNSNNIKDDEG